MTALTERRKPRWWPGLVLLAVAACLLADVAVRSADAAYLKPSNCLYDVPYAPPYEGWSATAHWSWLPLGAGCTYLYLEDGDVVVDDTSWTSTLVVGAAATAGLAALIRTAPFRRRRHTSSDR